jgi:SAM-dependent methyltransferase
MAPNRHWAATWENKAMEFPYHDREDVLEAAERLRSSVASDNELSRYLLGYFPQNLHRLAMNILFVQDRLKPGIRWLDVGSLGVEAAYLKNSNPDLRVHAISLEGNLVGVDEGGFTDRPGTDRAVRIDPVDVEREPFPYPENSFDLVTCFELVEHLKFSPLPVIREMKRVLSGDGEIVLTTPNVASYFSVRRILAGMSPLQCPYYHRASEFGIIHPREYTADEIRELLVSQGLDLKEVTTFDVQTPATGDRIAAFLCFALQVARNLLKGERKTFHRGEHILAVAGKGGPIISEAPAAIFGPAEAEP